MESGESSTGSDNTLEIIAIVTGAVSTFFVIVAISASLSFFYCHCCHKRRDRERTEDVECGESSPSPVASIGPVAFQPQGEQRERERERERDRERGGGEWCGRAVYTCFGKEKGIA